MVIRLHQTFGAHAGRVVELDRDVIRFGRLPDNEVAFDPHADLDASGRHAELRSENGHWVLVDVGSRNGTLVGGQRVTRHVMANGDEIEFGVGGPRVRVELVSAAPRGAVTGLATPIAGAGHIDVGEMTPIGHSGLGSEPPSQPGAGSLGPGFQNPTPPPSPFGQPVSGVPASAPPAQGQMPSLGGVPAVQQHAFTPPPGTAHPAAPSAAAQPPQKKYGQKTVGVMIQQALQQAGAQPGGSAKSTGYIRAVAQDAARKSSRGLKVVLAFVTLLLLGTAAGLIGLVVYGQKKEEALREEVVDLFDQLNQLDQDQEEEREALAQRIRDLNTELHTEQEATSADIAERNAGTVWVLLRTRSNGRREVVCTAFAVRADLLATNAHCVGDLERAMGRGDNVQAIANRGAGQALSIRQMWRHPNFVASAPASPDVGLVRLSGNTTQQVQIAPMSALSALRTGDDIFLLGFPSVIANNGAPVAGMTTGVVGRLTDFTGSQASSAMQHLVSHSAFADEGAQGSPLFDNQGRVIGLNAGNFRVRRQVMDTGTRVRRTVEADTPYAWAVRADLLLQLLAGMPD